MLQAFIDTTAVHNQRTGTSTYILNLLNGLSRSDRIEDVIACGGNRAIVSAAGAVSGVRFTHVTARSPHMALNFEWAGNRKSISSDICFFPNYFMPIGWPLPSAVTIHDVSFLTHSGFYSIKMRNWYRNRIKHTVSRADVVLTVSQTSRNAITKHLGIDPDRIIVLPPIHASCLNTPYTDATPADTNSFSPNDKPYFLYTGTIEPRKNLINLLDGFRAAGLKDMDLILIGRPNASVSYYKKFLCVLKKTPGARYLGYQNDQITRNYLAHCHGLVQLSWLEGFGIPLFHALERGIPALISDDPALCELAEGHALISKPDNFGMIANGLNELQCFNGNRSTMTQNWCRSTWSEEIWSRQLESAIDRLSRPSVPTIPLLSVQYPDTERAIVEGICYATVFNTSIHADKLFSGLRYTKTSQENFRTTLNYLLVTFPELFKSSESLIGLTSLRFRQKDRSSTEFRRRHRMTLKIIGSLPWIRSIYYSGGTAHGTGLEKNQDLDLFIVTRTNRAWLAYAAVRLISLLSARSRTVCCNYLVDESAMHINWQKDYYTAFQLLHLRQVILKSGTPHMRAVNKWIYDMFPNAPRFNDQRLSESGIETGLLYSLNLLVMAIYEYHWSKKGRINGAGGIRFDIHRIKLHTNDHRPAVYAEFQKVFGRVMGIIQTKKHHQAMKLNGNLTGNHVVERPEHSLMD